jgi:hypothetical protein
MKPIHSMTVFALLWFASSNVDAALSIPGADGSDGVFNVSTNTTIDLGLAVTGAWDANNSANAGKGVYDPAKWAVVVEGTGNLGAWTPLQTVPLTVPGPIIDLPATNALRFFRARPWP